jgi:hypothetical protein
LNGRRKGTGKRPRRSSASKCARPPSCPADDVTGGAIAGDTADSAEDGAIAGDTADGDCDCDRSTGAKAHAEGAGAYAEGKEAFMDSSGKET